MLTGKRKPQEAAPVSTQAGEHSDNTLGHIASLPPHDIHWRGPTDVWHVPSLAAAPPLLPDEPTLYPPRIGLSDVEFLALLGMKGIYDPLMLYRWRSFEGPGRSLEEITARVGDKITHEDRLSALNKLIAELGRVANTKLDEPVKKPSRLARIFGKKTLRRLDWDPIDPSRVPSWGQPRLNGLL